METKKLCGILLLILLALLSCDTKVTKESKIKKINNKADYIESQHLKEVHLTPEQIKEFNIIIEPLKLGNVNSIIQRPATVLFDPDRTVKVGPRISAKVEKVIVDLGKWVKPGDNLALLSSIELGKIKANYFTRLTRYKVLKANYLREKTLFKKKISSEIEYLEAKAQFEQAKEELHAAQETLKLYGLSPAEVEKEHMQRSMPLSYFYLKSPIEGIVQKRDLAPGETLSSKDTPFYIVDPREMWIMIDAYEQDITNVKTGQKVIFTISSLPEKKFIGTVDWISQSLDEQTRTLRVRIKVKNPELILKNGMYGKAFILSKTTKNKPIVPINAIQTIGNQHVIFIAENKPGNFRPIPITLGSENNGWVEILSELKPGLRIVTKGAFYLKATLTAQTRSDEH